MTKFVKPGKLDYPQMGKEAITNALKDAKVDYKQVQQATCGYVYGDSTCGQRVLYDVGMTGIPIVNVNNNCSTGSTALWTSKKMIEGGIVDCALAVGFEKMSKGPLTAKFDDRAHPMEKFLEIYNDKWGIEAAPMTAQLFGQAGKEHMKKYGTKLEHFAKIAHKNRKHSKNNPYAQFQEEMPLQQILDAQSVSILRYPFNLILIISSLYQVFDILTRPQCCPTSDGAGAAILASEEFVEKHGLRAQAVEIAAMEMKTDPQTSFSEKSAIKLVGYDMTASCAEEAYKKAGVSPNDIQVIELHDCFSANELITYEALGLCPIGKAGEFIDKEDNTYGGKYVVNPSGGLLSKGHPLGATGLAQCAELTWQVRGEADKRQVSGVKHALQQNIGLGGAVVVSIYKKGFPDAVKQP